MKKFIEKKIIVLLIIFLVGINSFAAIVADADGSTFITKSEFDSLKFDFNKQIDQYNTSIGSKIDGAIAEYLEGIKQSKKLVFDTFYKDGDTKTVNFMNGIIKTEYARPTMNMFNAVQIVVNKDGYINLSGSWGITLSNAWTTNGTNRRALLGLISGSEASIGDIYWRGIAHRYHEYYEMASTRYYLKTDAWVSGMDRSDTTHTVRLKNPCVIDYEGYNASIDRTKLNSKVAINYENSYSTSAAFTVSVWGQEKFVNQLVVKLDDYNNEKMDHTKLIQYDKTTTWELNNEEFNKTMKKFSGQTWTDKTIHDVSTIYKKGWHCGYYSVPTDTSTVVSKEIAWTIVNGTEKISSIGYAGNWTANSIYQTKTDIDKSFNEDWTLNKLTLEKGMPLCAAKKDSKITWTAVFDKVCCFNTTPNTTGTNYDTNLNEVDIYLATKPFTDKVAQSNSNDYIKFDDGTGTLKNYITTNGRVAKINFTMPESTIIYMKAVPHWGTGVTSYIDQWWDLYLNIDGENGQWTFVKADD